MSAALFDLLKAHIRAPLTLLDVGGHGGALENWMRFGDKARIFCFEARDDEAGDLASSNINSNVEYISTGLSDDHADLTIHVAAAAGCSSAYPPIQRIYDRLPGCSIMRPIRMVTCPATTIDDFMASRDIEAVHGLKLDTQGFELRILKGGGKALAECQFILVEAEFNALYEGQPLFSDVDRFLRDHGFVLWRLGNLAHYSTAELGGEPHRMLIGSEPGRHQAIDVPNGQLFWSDAFYVKHSATVQSGDALDRDQAIAGAALAAQWNFDDLALEMIRKSGDRELLHAARTALGLAFVETAPDFIPASAFQSIYLTLDGDMWESDFSSTDDRIVYGPYIQLPWGDLEAIFHVSAEGLGDQALRSAIEFDIAAEPVSFNFMHLTGQAGSETLRSGEVALTFHNESPIARFEFRVATKGRPFDGKLRFHGVTLKMLPDRGFQA